MSDNVDIVGKNSSAPFCAFGDESKFNDTLVYSFAIIRRTNIDRAVNIVNWARDNFKIPDDIPIHFRNLYSGHQRTKLGLGHLDIRDINKLIEKLIYHLNKLPIMCRYCYYYMQDNPIFMTQKDVFPELPNDPKGILGILMQGCFANKQDGTQGPPLSETEVFVSSDETKIKFLGNTRYQAHKGYQGFSDIETTNGRVNKILPHVIPSAEWKQYPLFQVADMFGYICSHADQSFEKNDFFTRMLGSLMYVRTKFGPIVEHQDK